MITNDFIFSIIGLRFEKDDIIFDKLALSNSRIPNTLSFLDDEKYVNELNENENIIGVITNSNIKEKLQGKYVLISDCPRYDFFSLMNKVSKDNYQKKENKIHPSVKINPSAYIYDYNVEIGENTIIEANVTIMPDVKIGSNCVIRSGCVIGSEGFEYKRTVKGILPVFHDGKVLIGNEVEIGANTCVDKGFSFRNTIIEDQVKIDNLIHVAHGVHIKKGAFIIAGTVLGGSAIIGEEAWLSINSSIAPGIEVKSKGFVSMGSVVTRNVEEGQQVTGNLAVDHSTFLKIFKNNLKIS